MEQQIDEILNNVLLIDDDEVSNFLSKSALEQFGQSRNITSTLSAKQALAYLKDQLEKNEAPDLIILDISMPEMDGWEFLREYNKLNSSLKAKIAIVVLSASVHPYDEEKAEAFDIVNAFKSKPITVDMVKDIHRRVLYLFH